MMTSFYASLISIWLIILSTRVIALRGNPIFEFFKFEKDDENSTERAIRGHSNLIEYSPIFLILLYLAEISSFNIIYMHCLGSAFFLGRLMHGFCFAFLKSNMFLRVGGTAITLGTLGIISTHLLVNYIF